MREKAMYEGHWLRIYRRIAWFAGRLPAGVVAIEETYVNDYHKMLAELEHLSGLELSDFDISGQYLQHVKIYQDLSSSKVVQSTNRFIDRQLLKQRVKALKHYIDQKFTEFYASQVTQ